MDALYCHPEPTKTCHPNKAHSKIVILSEAEGSEFLRLAALSQDDRMGRALRMGRYLRMTGWTLCRDDKKARACHSREGTSRWGDVSLLG